MTLDILLQLGWLLIYIMSTSLMLANAYHKSAYWMAVACTFVIISAMNLL